MIAPATVKEPYEIRFLRYWNGVYEPSGPWLPFPAGIVLAYHQAYMLPSSGTTGELRHWKQGGAQGFCEVR